VAQKSPPWPSALLPPCSESIFMPSLSGARPCYVNESWSAPPGLDAPANFTGGTQSHALEQMPMLEILAPGPVGQSNLKPSGLGTDNPALAAYSHIEDTRPNLANAEWLVPEQAQKATPSKRRGKGKTSRLENLTGFPSRGSKNHHLGQCRPCRMHLSARGCKDGVNCNFCHSDHNTPSAPTEMELKVPSCSETTATTTAPSEMDSQSQSEVLSTTDSETSAWIAALCQENSESARFDNGVHIVRLSF